MEIGVTDIINIGSDLLIDYYTYIEQKLRPLLSDIGDDKCIHCLQDFLLCIIQIFLEDG